MKILSARIRIIKRRQIKPRGITLIEILISLGILLIIILILATTINTMRLGRKIGFEEQAYRVASEELEIVQNLPASDLIDTINGNLKNTFYNQGGWKVINDATAPSSNNVLALDVTRSIAETGLSGALILPGNGDYSDFSFEAQIKLTTSISTSTLAGMIIRAKDAQNYYRLSIKNNLLSLEKIQNGATTILWSASQTFTANTWYKLKATSSGANLTLFLNDTQVGSASDNAFAQGKLGFFSGNGTKISIDNADITGTLANSWNFDADAVGALPSAFARFGLFDLPEGHGYLTIANTFPNISTLKTIIVRVTWLESNQTRSAELITLKNL